MGSVRRQPGGGYLARYYADGKQYGRRFQRAAEAKAWVADQEAAARRGEHLEPDVARMTVDQWLERWLEGYGARARPSTVRQARTHAKAISAEFGSRRLASIRPSDVSSWVARLGDSYADSTRYAVYRRFAQVMGDAVHEGLIPRSPCSRRTAPRQGGQRVGVASVAQVWQLHDALSEHLRPAVLLGAFAGLRVGEVCGLRGEDVDLAALLVTPRRQWGGAPLKSESSEAPVPIPADLGALLPERPAGSAYIVDEGGRPVSPWVLSRAVAAVRSELPGLPEGFRFHDLRHTYASLLIAGGLDVKTVQARLRHASAVTTLNVYGHLFRDADERSRAAVAAALQER